MDKEKIETANRIIDALGGTQATKDICKFITKGAVSNWRKTGIPKAWLRFFESNFPHLFVSSTDRRKSIPKKALVVKNCQETFDPNFEDRRGNK